MRRGGSLTDDDHRLLAVWAADCAQHVLHHFEQARPGDDRPRRVIDLGRAWARGEIPMKQAHNAAFVANAAARDVTGAAREAAYAAGQAVAVAHVAAHELGAAAYAIRAARAASPEARSRRWSPGVPVAARPATRRDQRARARRPAAAQRVVLVRLRLLSGEADSREPALRRGDVSEGQGAQVLVSAREEDRLPLVRTLVGVAVLAGPVGLGRADPVDRARRGGRGPGRRRCLLSCPSLRPAACVAVPAPGRHRRSYQAHRDRDGRHRHALREPALHG